MKPSPSPTVRVRKRRFGWVLLLAALFAAERGWDLLRHRSLPELRSAEWIWAPGAAETSVPVAFYAVRDFDVRADSLGAALHLGISAEDEYQAFVNGRFVGGGSWSETKPIDVFDVSGLVSAGRNRVLVELRSLRGVGGLLAGIYPAEGVEALVVTDDHWRIVRHHKKGLHEGFASIEGSPRAWSWGEPPTGRWGRIRLANEVTDLFVVPGNPVEPRDRVAWALEKSKSQLCETAEELQASSAALDLAALPPAGKRHCEPLFEVDFGAERCGFLEVELEGRPQVVYRVWFGRVGDDFPGGASDEYAQLVPGTSRWRSSHAHDFSRVWIAGVSDVRAARLRLRDGTEPRDALPEQEDGVWGLEPPPPPLPPSS